MDQFELLIASQIAILVSDFAVKAKTETLWVCRWNGLLPYHTVACQRRGLKVQTLASSGVLSLPSYAFE
jgi:hypothetical protein